jgi:hypothetical protein
MVTEMYPISRFDPVSVRSKLKLLHWCMFAGPKQEDIVMYQRSLCRGKLISLVLFEGTGTNVLLVQASLVIEPHHGTGSSEHRLCTV